MEKLGLGQFQRAGQLFERYKVAVYRFFVGLGGHPSEAEDLTQTVFERIIKYRHTFKTGSNFKTWMYQIARNTWADHLKKGMKNQYRPLDGIPEPADQDPFWWHEQKEKMEQLHRALDFLDPDQRELLNMARFQELKYSEIAQILQITEGAVKVRVHRAINELKNLFFKLEHR